MGLPKMLEQNDPSRYTVYQMLGYTRNILGVDLVQEFFRDIFLFKTNPSIDSLYNYAHIFKKSISEEELSRIRDFFGNDPYRIKILEDDVLRQILISYGLTLKDTGYIMVADDVGKRDYEYSLPENVYILPLNNELVLKDYKLIFSEAFNYDLQSTNNKFGFQDGILLNDGDNHINAFVLYENGIPASAGAYYAFDNFSIENIGTRVAFRGKKYAHLIMQCLLNEAKKMDYNTACLVASETGSKVYQNLGFKILAKTNTFTV
ncbi:MAG: hypothetical protein ACP5NV_01950 [Candidatus Woesearchaeota archaeon]